MKKTILSILLLLIWFFGFTFADLEFTNYEILGQIQNDGTINVQENIDVHFFNQMHGIERKFDYSYTVEDIEFATIVDNITVPDYNYKIIDEYYQKNIRIWDADRLVDWDKKYEIDYSMYWLIRNFSGMWYSELYRNVVWYDRSNSIQNTQIELTLPKAYSWLTKDDFLITAWYSDKKTIDEFDWEVKRDENKIYITYNHKLPSYEWITLAVKFPNWYFEFDHEKQGNLLVWYANDFNIENYKINWTIDKSWNIIFQNEIELEVLNEDPIVRWDLPYRYDVDWKTYLVKLKDITINWEEINWNEYDTTLTNKSIIIPWDFEKNNIITSSYSIYGLIRPFSGEFKEWTYNLYATSWDFDEWAYRLYLELPVLDLDEKIKNLNVSLDIPGGCSTVYAEDIYVNLWNWFINMNEFNEKYGYIRCRDNKLALTYSWEIWEYSSIILTINFVKWTFDLDDELLQALAVAWTWDFYYWDKVNRQSVLIWLLIIIFGWGYEYLMDKRYKTKSRMNKKCVIQYDAPRWVDAPEAWVLIDNELNWKDLTSLIYQRAANHYIKIYAEDGKYKSFYIKKLKQLPNTTKKYQLDLFNSLFKSWEEFHISKDKSQFTDYLKTAKKDLTNYIDQQDWFKTPFYFNTWNFFRHQTISIIILTIVWLIILFSCLISSLTSHLISINRWVILLFVALLIFVVLHYRNYEKNTNTKKWEELRDHCVWFKDFLMKVDKVKLETLMAQDPLYIEKVLPYAVVFWVSSKFIKAITPYLEEIERFDGDLDDLIRSIRYIDTYTVPVVNPAPTHSSSWSYSSSGWFSSGSSFGWWFSSWWGGGGGWWGWR